MCSRLASSGKNDAAKLFRFPARGGVSDEYYVCQIGNEFVASVGEISRGAAVFLLEG